MLLVIQEGEVASKTETSTEVVKPQLFDRTVENILGFVMAYKLFIRMKMREKVVEEQIQ